MRPHASTGSARATLRFARALLATNIKGCLALRGAFLLQAAGMAANNVLFFCIWWIFFDRYDEVRGWRLTDMAGLYGVVAAGFGAAGVLAGGIRDLAASIHEGELDGMLSQPPPTLLYAVGSRSHANAWGDLASGLVFALFSGLVHPQNVLVLGLAIGLSTTMFIAAGILLHSSAFWLGRVGSLARMMADFMVTFSIYPQSIFPGALRLMLFTVIPAGFIGHLPVSLLRDFDPGVLLIAAGGAAVYLALAVFVFHRGLRRYESGSRFGVRA